MNNQNYIGSSIFVVNLDFHHQPERIKEEERALELMRIGAKEFGGEAIKKYEKLKRQMSKRQLSVVNDVNLPPIK